MERFGLVGLPNAGKSSLYNALTNGAALAAPYPFATKDPNIGVAKVLDPRLEALAEMSKTQRTVYATVEVVDIGGLVEGASKGEGLGNKFLANIREVDAIVFVLRAFVDDDIPGPSDPLEHLRVVEIELALADLETVETRINRAQKAARMDKSLGDEMGALERAQAHLSEGRPLYRAGLSKDDLELLAPHFLLTTRQVLAVVNVAEDALDTIPEMEARVRAELAPPGSASEHNIEVLGMSVQLEAEAAQLTGQDRIDMLEALGLGEGALPRMIRSAYHLLGLRTYFTTGEKKLAHGHLMPAQKHQSAQERFTPTCNAASFAPTSLHGTNCWKLVRGTKPKTWARFALKAKTTKWSTATCLKFATTARQP